jgi:hypothetical protein
MAPRGSTAIWGWPDGIWPRFSLRALLLAASLAAVSPCVANDPGPQPPSSPPVAPAAAEVGAEFAATDAGGTVPGAGPAATGIPEQTARATPGRGERKDMTIFFSIGAILNVLLLGVFLTWAIGQRRKAKNRSLSTDV